MSPHPIIRISDLCFRYGTSDPTVLENLSLTIPAGKITTVLGPNGTGKTTLLHLILGMLTPQAGSIRIDGHIQSTGARRRMSHLIGLVPQGEYVAFDFSLLEYVLLGRAPYLGALQMPDESDYEIALDALRSTGLLELWHRSVPNLSGGERQLAMVARALAQQTSILLLDEPTSHLDLGNKWRVLNLLCDLSRKGTTIVLTTHDPNIAAAIADHVVFVRDGRVLASGTKREVFTSENLSRAYGVPVNVLEVQGRPLVLNS